MEQNEGGRGLGEEEEAGAHHFHHHQQQQQQEQEGRSLRIRKEKKKQLKVRALFFAHARELAGGVSEASLEVEEGWTTAQCLEEIITRFPALKALASCLTLALNDSYVDKNVPSLVKDGDELALIPPISGG